MGSVGRSVDGQISQFVGCCAAERYGMEWLGCDGRMYACRVVYPRDTIIR